MCVKRNYGITISHLTVYLDAKHIARGTQPIGVLLHGYLCSNSVLDTIF
jgi:hypothetical protein